MKEKKMNIGVCAGLVIVSFVLWIVSEYIGAAIGGSFLKNLTEYQMMSLAAVIKIILLGVLLVIAGKKYIFTKNISKFGKGLLVGLFSIGYSFFSLGTMLGMAAYNKTELHLSSNSVWFTAAMFLSAGICEELLFRGCIMNFIRDAAGRNTKKGLFISIIISSILFGSIHFLNLGIAPTKIVIYQVIMASFAGFYFGAVYARTDCLWVGIFLHFLNDFCVMFTTGFMGGSQIGESIGDSMANVNPAGAVVNFFLQVGIGLFLLRKKKIHECFEKTEESEKVDMTNAVYAN